MFIIAIVVSAYMILVLISLIPAKRLWIEKAIPVMFDILNCFSIHFVFPRYMIAFA